MKDIAIRDDTGQVFFDGLNELIDSNKLGAPVKFDFKAGCG